MQVEAEEAGLGKGGAPRFRKKASCNLGSGGGAERLSLEASGSLTLRDPRPWNLKVATSENFVP